MARLQVIPGGLENKTPSTNLRKEIKAYDIAFSTSLCMSLDMERPEKAFSNIEYSGLSDSDRIRGYVLIYSWIWNELSGLASTKKTKEGIRARLRGIMENARISVKTREYSKLLKQLESKILPWCGVRAKEAKVTIPEVGKPVPFWLYKFGEKIPNESSLRKAVDKLLYGEVP